MTEQQQHLQNLLQQRSSIEQQLVQGRELLLKVQGAIEYLTQIGVTLEDTENQSTELTETEVVE
jgi:hypothetical protein